MMKYRCLYNLELLILGTAKTPWQDYDEPIREDSAANYVRQLKGTDVDAMMLCPTAWKRMLWRSKVDRHWDTEAPKIKDPTFTTELTYFEKAYFRLREYILRGGDPLGEAIKECRRQNIAPFISYRMNDHHYLEHPEAPIHPTFWRENPQLWLDSPKGFFDYMKREVRDWYAALLFELLDTYDVEGLELDFMRSPYYFRADQIEEGCEVMTDFVRRIRAHMDELGSARGHRLSLCVRVPHTVKWCREVGLDVGRWDAEGLIDMVNVSSYYINTPEIDVEGYKEWVKNAPLYGEMHFITGPGKLYSGFDNNVNRKTTKEIYRALAANFLDRGMDGLSFFNIDYTRHHFFNEPRRLGLFDGQPPLAEFAGITDREHLSGLDKHYFLGPSYSPFPQKNNMQVKLYLADRDVEKNFRHAILRIRTAQSCMGFPMEVTVNGTPVEEMQWLGELFAPISIEALPAPETVRYFAVPTALLRHADNEICAVNKNRSPHGYKQMNFVAIELALYKNNSFMD